MVIHLTKCPLFDGRSFNEQSGWHLSLADEITSHAMHKPLSSCGFSVLLNNNHHTKVRKYQAVDEQKNKQGPMP